MLNPFFSPKSVAVVGASREPKSVGQGILRNLLKGCVFPCPQSYGFAGKIFAVNPNAAEILGVKCYPSITKIDDDVDVAVVCTPAAVTERVVAECIKKKVKGIIIISAGFAEAGEAGKKLQDKIVKMLEKAKIPLVGPNCLGVIRPVSNLNASFAPATPPKGGIAFISQSGALADSIIDWAIEERYGFSAVISYGNAASLKVEDFLGWLEADDETKAIALYLEGVEDGKRFVDTAKRVGVKKPIVALKGGRGSSGRAAVMSHTASLAGDYDIYKAAFRQSGITVADTVEELFDNAKALATQQPCSNGVAIVTNGGGCGVLMADYCEEQGVNVVELRKETVKKLDSSGKMHPAYSRRNPLDIIGDALPERYEAAINTLLGEDYVSGMIVIQTLQTMTNPMEDAEVVIRARQRFPNKPVLCVYMGGRFSREATRKLEENNIPDYNDLRKAAISMKALIRRKEWLDKQGS